MAIPVYLWLKDDGGADIKGSVDVQDREGSIEVVAREPGDRSKRGARRVCRFNSGDLLVRTAVRVDEALLGRLCDAPDPRGTALFGVLVLLPFLHRVYRQESSLIDELFFG